MKWLHFSGVRSEKRFEEVYQEHYKAVYNYVYRIMLHQQDTEDVVSETFLKAMRFFDRYDADKGFILNWLCGIAHNCAVDFLRAGAVRAALSLEDLLEREELPEDAHSEWPDDSTEWEAWEILRRLRVQDRELLAWRYALGLSDREIGDRLGVSAKAANERLRRVLAKCRGVVQDRQTGG